jgi:hypothetical protein
MADATSPYVAPANPDSQRGGSQTRTVRNNKLERHILGDEAYGEKRMDSNGMVDITILQVGQNGFRTDFEGFVNNSAYVRRNIIAVLVEAPRGFQHLPQSQFWVATLKSLIELHAQTIEGLTSTLTVSYVENAVGGAGEMQEDLQNVVRERSTPTFTWVEKYGKPINAFFEGWITNLMMDPITKVPNIMTRNDPQKRPTDILPDYTSCTVLFIEPDPTHTRVVSAWLSTNMMPDTAGETVGSRDLTSPNDSTVYTIKFTALTQQGLGVQLLAQRYMDEMNMSAVNPNLKPAFVQHIEEDIVAEDSGYQDQLDRASTISVQASGANPGTAGLVKSQYSVVTGDPVAVSTNLPDYTNTGVAYRTAGVSGAGS